MVVRTRTIRLTPGTSPQAIDWLRSEALPRFSQAPGCTGVLVLAVPSSTPNTRLEIISRWKSRQALDAFDGVADQYLQSLPGLAEPVEGGICKVALAAGVAGGTVARYIAAHLPPGYIDKVVTLFENVVMHAATEQRGFRRGLLLVDRPGNRAISIGLWQTEADLLASEQVGYLGRQIRNFIPIVESPIVPETLTVAIEWDADGV